MKLRAILLAVAMAAPMAPVHIAQAEPQLERNDPNYVRCRKLDVTGSLAKKVRVCRTNAEWAEWREKGRFDAQQIFENNLKGSSSHDFIQTGITATGG